MDFNEIIMNRYACKKFNGKVIPQDKIEELKNMIKYSPSSFNLQPWKIKIISLMME